MMSARNIYVSCIKDLHLGQYMKLKSIGHNNKSMNIAHFIDTVVSIL